MPLSDPQHLDRARLSKAGVVLFALVAAILVALPPGSSRAASAAPMAYPDRAVALYHMMWSNSGSPRLADTPANVNVVNLAFGQGDPPRLPGWASQTKDQFVADANALRDRGVRMVLSVGGSGGHVNVGNREAFVDGVMAINADVPLDGLDWDLEGPALTESDVVWISTELKRRRGQDFAITMAPNGSNIDTYRRVAVALQRADALDMIGQQFYDAVVSKADATWRVNQLIDAGIPASKVAVGMMVGPQNTYWTVEECLDVVRSIKSQHPDLRGGYLWEAGRDGTADWADRVGAVLLEGSDDQGPGQGTDTEEPAPPPGVTAEATSPTAVEVTWGEASDNVGVSEYVISRDGTVVATVDGTARNWQDTGLTAETAYRYIVSARDAAGNQSDPSEEVTVTTPDQVCELPAAATDG